MKSKEEIGNMNSIILDAPIKVNEAMRIVKVMSSRWWVIFGMVIVIFFLLVSVIGPAISPYDPIAQNLKRTLEPPSSDYLLGTDSLGRDILSRIISGTRISLLVGVVAVSIAGIIGMGLGLIAGYFGGWVNNIIMRLIDAFMAIPPIALSLAIAAVLGGGIKNIMLAIGIAMIPTYCRLMCGQVLTLKETDYILAASIGGANDIRIMLRHILPNAFPPLLVLITLNMGTAILMEASLSFLGIGIEPPQAAWGSMINDGYRFLLSNPVISFAPGAAIMLVVLAFNMVGDGLRDALDPRLRGIL